MSGNEELNLSELKVGFIGAGNMAYALAKGLIQSGLIKASNVWASAPSDKNIGKLKELSCNCTSKNEEVVRHTTVSFICVKPHKVAEVISGIYQFIDTKCLIVSVAAGITLTSLEMHLPNKCRVIRVMPNTPSLVQAGASVFSRGTYTTSQDCALISTLLSTVSLCEEVPESMMDSIGALCGCGPAFIYVMIQAMSDGAVKMGVPRMLASKFSAQVVMGAAKMVLETEKHPEVLKDEVCSPGGTTICGIHALEEGGLRATMMNALQSATNRSKELGNQ